MHNHEIVHQHITRSGTRKSVYLSGLLLSFHYVFVVYISSSYLSAWFSQSAIGLIYAAGAVITIIGLIITPILISQFGNRRIMLAAIIFEMVSLAGLAIGTTVPAHFIASFFIIHTALVSILYYHLDIFLEETSADETTGKTRGTFLTLLNITFVLIPVIAGFIVSKSGYPTVYTIATLFLIPLFLVIARRFNNTINTTHIPRIHEGVTTFLKNKDLGLIFTTSFLLHFFYTWMTIYTPLYLATILGFEWNTIGLMFSIMLIPFVLFQLPLGTIADKFLGEKEIMIVGFLILGFATMTLTFLPASFFLWTATLFITRIGASAVEIMTETYFFKKITAEQAGEISFFRMTRPLGLLIAPAIAAGTLFIFNIYNIPFSISFVVLGVICLLGTIPAFLLKDTK